MQTHHSNLKKLTPLVYEFVEQLMAQGHYNAEVFKKNIGECLFICGFIRSAIYDEMQINIFTIPAENSLVLKQYYEREVKECLDDLIRGVAKYWNDYLPYSKSLFNGFLKDYENEKLNDENLINIYNFWITTARSIHGEENIAKLKAIKNLSKNIIEIFNTKEEGIPRSKKVTKNPINNDVGFEQYLIDPKLLIKLQTEFSNNGSPKKIALMIYALHELNYLINNPLTGEHTELHQILTKSFGSIGGRAGLNNYINHANKEKGIIATKKFIIKLIEEKATPL